MIGEARDNCAWEVLHMHRFAESILAIILLVSTASSVLAAPPDLGPSDPAELGAFLDPIFAKQLEEYQIPGAVFVLVKDGRILFTKGYGLANVEKGTPVVPDRSLFAIGSVTKLFTATAVMQLAEQGKLDLHADINQYLKAFQIPATFPEPIAAAHLLTHTAGFDEKVFGMAVRSSADLEPLGQYLARELPRRVRPPGQQSQYSNHGMALAGYLVEAVSGRSYNQYISDEILRPLGMNHSTMEMPRELADDIVPVNGYVGDPPVRQPDWFLNIGPAGDLKATATDMAAFMIAHLQNGDYQGKRIFRDETARTMHALQFAPHPEMPGVAYGFFERLRNGHRAIEHAGDTLGTSSMLTLLPDENWGFFVSYNGPKGSLAREELIGALLDRYAPGQVALPSPSEALKGDVARYAGTYLLNRTPRDSFAKLQGLITSFPVVDNGDGTLTVRFPMNALPSMHLVPVAPLLFRTDDGRSTVAFQEDDRGRITRIYIPMVLFTGERLAWYQTPALHIGLLAAVAVLVLTAFVAWPAGALLRRLRGRPSLPAQVRAARWLGWTVSALLLTFLAGLGVFMASALATAVYGIPGWVKPVMVTAMLGAALTVPLVWAAVRACRVPGWSVWGKVHMVLLTLAAVLFVPFLQYWNLLGFRF
jgi:CubicO group peptidase (beta-lactamase class C family)